MKLKTQLDKYVLILLAIILFGAFLRFYNFPNRIYVGNEQGRDFFVSLVAAKEIQFPMTGPWSSIGPITTGPWYWYYLILMRLLIPIDLSPWIAMGIASLLTIPILYKTGTLLIDKKFGLILALLAAMSPTLIESSVYVTNPFILGFFSSLAVLLFVLSFKHPRLRYFTLLGFVVGINLQIHYQAVGLLLLPAGLALLPAQKIKAILFAMLGFAISAIPMAFFELNNHFFNTWHLMDFYFNTSKTFYTPMRWLTFVTQVFPKLWSGITGGSEFFGLTVMVISALTTAYLLYKKKFDRTSLILLISFVAQVIMVRYWKGEIYLARVEFLVPYLILFTGLVLYSVSKVHKWGIGIIIIFMAIIWPSVSNFTFSSNDAKTKIHKELAAIQAIYPNEKFSLYFCDPDTYSRNMKDEYFLMLYLENKYSDSGRKLLIKHDRPKPLPEEECPALPVRLPVIEWVWDINSLSDEEINQLGWKKETTKNLYDRTVKWWYKEKP